MLQYILVCFRQIITGNPLWLSRFRIDEEFATIIDPVQVGTQQDAIAKTLLAAALNRYNMRRLQRILTGFTRQRTAAADLQQFFPEFVLGSLKFCQGDSALFSGQLFFQPPPRPFVLPVQAILGLPDPGRFPGIFTIIQSQNVSPPPKVSAFFSDAYYFPQYSEYDIPRHAHLVVFGR